MSEKQVKYREICELESREGYPNVIFRQNENGMYEVVKRIKNFWFEFWKPKYDYQVIEDFTPRELNLHKSPIFDVPPPPRVFLHYSFDSLRDHQVVFRYHTFYVDKKTLETLSKELDLKIT